MQKYDKLVRDHIPDIIRSRDGEPIVRVLNDQEYWEYLLKKDIEELEEVKKAESLQKEKKN